MVLCTGFDNKVGDVLRGTLPAQMQSAKFDAKTPFATSAAVQDVKGAVAPGLSPQTIARQVVGESVYVCGPAAGDLTVGEVLNGPNTNPVSIFNTGPRSAALGRSIALAPGLNAKKFFTPKTLQPALTMSAAGGSATMAVVPDAELPAAPAYSDLQVKTLLSLALDRFRYPGVKKLELEVRQEVQDSARVLVVSSPQLDAASVSKLKAAIEGDRELHGLLTLFTRTGVIREVSFSVQVDAGSDRVWPASMRMTR